MSVGEMSVGEMSSWRNVGTPKKGKSNFHLRRRLAGGVRFACAFSTWPRNCMISHRFDCYVDEHFKTRKWALEFIIIRRKIGKNGTMEIVNYNGKPLPMPKIQLPRKISGFKCITISYIDRNVIAFLHRFRPFLASFCPINLFIIRAVVMITFWCSFCAKFGCCSEKAFVALNCPPDFSAVCDNSCRHFSPIAYLFASSFSILAISSLNFRPMTAFANASSPVNFIAVIWFPSSFANSVFYFDLTNELTREQLALKGTEFSRCFLLVRCPIVRDESKWAKWEKEAIDWRICDQWNRIDIQINDQDGIEDGLLDATFGQSY